MGADPRTPEGDQDELLLTDVVPQEAEPAPKPTEPPLDVKFWQVGPPHGQLIKAWHILLVAGTAIGTWILLSFWTMMHSPTEAERASILKVAETFATAGFFYYLGSSAGSRNKEHS